MCCCFQPWKSRFGSSCEDKVIRAEQLAGLMPIHRFSARNHCRQASSVAWKIEVFRTVIECLGPILTNKFYEGQPERPVSRW